jgi:hypothetical protein
MPETVADWAAAMRQEFAGPLGPPITSHYASAAADLARAGSAQTAGVTGTPWDRVKRRLKMVSTTFLSTSIAKIMGGTLAVAAAVGGTVAAGVDFHDILPFLSGDGSETDTTVETHRKEDLLTTTPTQPPTTTPTQPPTTTPTQPPTTTPTQPPTTTPTQPPPAAIPPTRPPLSPPVGPPG